MATLAKLVVSIGANTAEFEANLKKVSSQLKTFQKETAALEPMMNAVGTALKTVGVAMVTAFVGAGTMALNSAAKIETFRLSLTTLMGSSKAAGEAVANALNLASKTPFTDDQLLAASVALQKFGQDAITVLPQVANMAAATNGDVEQAAEAFGGFLQGRVKALQAFGITKAQVLAEGAATETGIEIANQKGQIVNEAAYSAALLSLMDKRFKAGAELRANSIAGLKKSLLDVADDALRTMAGVTDQGDIMAGGLADTFKKSVTLIIAKIEEWKANGSLQEWADNVGKAITVFFTNAKRVFDFLVDVAVVIAKNWDAIIPVIGGVVGAFVTFKLATAYVDAAALAVKLFGYAVAGTLGPLGWAMAGVTILTAGVVYLIEKLNQQKALLNSMTAAGMAAYDTETLNTGTSMTDAGQDPTAYYASRVAGHQKYVDAIKQQNDQLARDALASRNATSAAYAKEKQDEYAKTLANNAKIVASDADLANKIYDLTHTTLQAKLHAIDVTAAADLAAGKNAVQVATWVKVAKAAANKDAFDAAARLTEAATKKTAEEAVNILGINADLNDQIYKLSHTTVEGQIYDLDKVRDKAIADGGSKLAADKAYALASQKVYADAAAEKAKVEKEAADKAAAAWETANDKQVQDIKDTYDEYLAALGDYVDQQKDVGSMLTQTIIDNYGVQEDAAVSAFESERDTAIDTINDQIDARNRALEVTLDNISKEKDAMLGQYDAQIQALEDAHAAAQRAETLTRLRTDLAAAETPEERLRAQKALDKELADEAYNDKLDSLRKLKATASDFWDAQTETAKTVAASDLQVLKDQVTATQTSYDARITSVTSYYGDLMLLRNADAEAEKLLAGNTQSNIITMLRGRLDEWKGLGTQIGDSLYSGLQGAIGSLSTSIMATVPIAPISEGGGGISLKAHGAGGYFTTPHVALIAERGPEFVVPESRAAEFAGKMAPQTVNVTYVIAASDTAGIKNELRQHDKELLGMLRGGRW